MQRGRTFRNPLSAAALAFLGLAAAAIFFFSFMETLYEAFAFTKAPEAAPFLSAASSSWAGSEWPWGPRRAARSSPRTGLEAALHSR